MAQRINVVFASLVLFLLRGGIFAGAQALTRPAGDLINADRPLTQTEVLRVMEAVRAAVEGKAFRLEGLPNSQGPRIEVLMGAGRPRLYRWGSDDLGKPVDWGFVFVHGPAITLNRPEVAQIPTCVR